MKKVFITRWKKYVHNETNFLHKEKIMFLSDEKFTSTRWKIFFTFWTFFYTLYYRKFYSPIKIYFFDTNNNIFVYTMKMIFLHNAKILDSHTMKKFYTNFSFFTTQDIFSTQCKKFFYTMENTSFSMKM